MDKIVHNIKVVSLVILLFATTTLFGSNQIQFLHFDKTNDFPFSTVDNVMQDSYGYLWIGSYTGLVRYDGYTFELYTTQDKKNGLPSNRIFCTFESSKKEILVGTNLGLSVYNRQTNTFQLLSYSCTPQICEDSNNQIWVATFDGIDVRNSKTLKIKKSFFCETDKKITIFNSITIDSFGRIWALTANNGIYIFDSRTLTFLNKIDSKKIKNIENIDAYNMVFDKNGKLWMGTSGNGLICVDTSTFAIKTFVSNNSNINSLGSNNISNVYVDSKNDVWVCCQYGYLNKYNRKDDSFERFMPQESNSRFINSNSISCINQDKAGNYWIGTFGNGMYCRSAMYNNFKTYIPSNIGTPKSKSWPVMSFVELDNGTIAYACDGGGIRFYNPNDNTINDFVNNSQLFSKNITKIIKHNGCLWLATWGGGIVKIDLKTNAVSNFKNDSKNPNSINLNNIKALFAEDSALFIGTQGDGIAIYNYSKNKFSHKRNSKGTAFNPEINNWVNDIQRDTKGNLWISTFYGLHRLKNNAVTHYGTTKSSNSINSFEVLSTFEDKNKQLWVLTSQGIDLFDYKTSTFTHISELYSLPSGARSFIMDNNGDLWLSTSDKLFRISMIQKRVFEYDKNDGIVSGEFSVNAAFKSKDGTLYFGSADGFMKWKPSDIKEDTIKPRIVFRNLYVNYKIQTIDSVYLKRAIETVDSLTYEYTSDVISVEVAATLLGRIDKINYSYHFDKGQTNWLNLGKGRTISLTALSPGTHILTVKANVEHGVSVEKNLIIIVYPKWWMTWWFRIFMAMLATLAVVLFIYLRLQNIRKKNIQLEKLVHERTIDLAKANTILHDQSIQLVKQSDSLLVQNERLVDALDSKDRLIKIIAHDFKNPLFGIQGLSKLLKEKFSNLTNENIHNYLNDIYSASNRLSVQMNDVLDWAQSRMADLKLKTEEVNIEAIIADVLSLLEVNYIAKNISIITQYNFSSTVLVDVRMAGTIIRNILINAIKFTPRAGKISILVFEFDNGIEINIVDTGIGMSNETIEKLFKSSFNASQYGTENEKGMGLGLQISKSFIEKNNGALQIKSREGEGSAFIISFPKGTKTAERVPEKVEASTLEEINNNISNGIDIEVDKDSSILIIDDESEVLTILKSVFDPYYTVYTASDGRAGLQLARNLVPNLIISDINMPYNTGLEICDALKQDEMTIHIPIILITSLTDNQTQIDSYKSGADDFIEKPINNSVLVYKVQGLLKNRKKLIERGQISTTEKTFLMPESQDDVLMKRILTFINENFKDSEFDVNIVAEKIGISRAQLWRKFKSTTGTNISDYILELRMKLALEMLNTGKYRTSEIAYDVGYSTPAYFTKCFVAYFGETPKDYLERIAK